MSLGLAWLDLMGSVEEETSLQHGDAYADADAGGNFIDTADNYQDERFEFGIRK